jgi:hypothetical protein
MTAAGTSTTTVGDGTTAAGARTATAGDGTTTRANA